MNSFLTKYQNSVTIANILYRSHDVWHGVKLGRSLPWFPAPKRAPPWSLDSAAIKERWWHHWGMVTNPSVFVRSTTTRYRADLFPILATQLPKILALSRKITDRTNLLFFYGQSLALIGFLDLYFNIVQFLCIKIHKNWGRAHDKRPVTWLLSATSTDQRHCVIDLHEFALFRNAALYSPKCYT